MKEQAEVLEEQKELNEALLEKVCEIRNLCLKIDFIEKKGHSYTYLSELCQQLLISINSPEEYKRIFNELPCIAGKIVHKQYIEKFIDSLIDKVSSMPELLTILADYPKLQKQIIKACARKNIKNAGDLRSVLEYASNNSDLQLVTIEAIGRPKLDSFIKSVGDLCLILEMLSADLVPSLGKSLVEQFATLFRTRKQLFNSLQGFSKNPRLQELLIETLCEIQLAKLRGSGYKTAILSLFEDDGEDKKVFRDIVKRAFTSNPNCFVRFFRHVFHESSTGGQAQNQTPAPTPWGRG